MFFNVLICFYRVKFCMQVLSVIAANVQILFFTVFTLNKRKRSKCLTRLIDKRKRNLKLKLCMIIVSVPKSLKGNFLKILYNAYCWLSKSLKFYEKVLMVLKAKMSVQEAALYLTFLIKG